MATRDRLHQIIDELPEHELDEAERALLRLRSAAQDPVLQAFLEAPEVDEPLSAEDLQAIEEARKELANGQGLTLEEFLEQMRRAG